MLENITFSKKETFTKGMWCFKFYKESLKTGRRVLIEKSEIEEKSCQRTYFIGAYFVHIKIPSFNGNLSTTPNIVYYSAKILQQEH